MAGGGTDWFKIFAIVAGVVAGLAMLGGLALVLAAFFWVGA
ncbi:hypothetical protein [Propioniciclava sp. MC1595]|nr:hypothetical protein [Propioniciclava sp. MC1595]